MEDRPIKKNKKEELLLTKFLYPTIADDFIKSDYWGTMLGENAEQTINRLIDEGLIVEQNLNAVLDYKFKATELKTMLKQWALPVSGRKEDMINRLIHADPEGMKGTVAGVTLFSCSEQGRAIAERYLAAEEARKTKMKDDAFEHLKQGKFKEAAQIFAIEEAIKATYPGGLKFGYDPQWALEMLKSIFSGTPKILSSLTDDQLTTLRLAAGMMVLTGANRAKEWCPPNFTTGLIMNNDAAARMLIFQASQLRDMAQFRRSGVVEQVEISTAGKDSCKVCKTLSGKTFKLNEVPELPYEHCSHEMGCRCILLAVIE